MDELLARARTCRACAPYLRSEDLLSARPDLRPDVADPDLAAPYLRVVDQPGCQPLAGGEWAELQRFLGTQPSQWTDLPAVYCRPYGGDEHGFLGWVPGACHREHTELFHAQRATRRRILAFSRMAFDDREGAYEMGVGWHQYLVADVRGREHAAVVRHGRMLHASRGSMTGEKYPWLPFRNAVLVAWLDQTTSGVAL